MPELSTNSLNGHVLNPIIDFNFIVDTDIGLIRLIREKYNDPKAFNLSVLNKSDREILSLLYLRKNKNPLSVISTEENMPDIDDLYNSFFINYKKEIIQKSIAEQSIVKFIKLSLQSGLNFGIAPYIFISDDIEQNEIRKKFSGVNFITQSNNKSLLDKEIFYVKDYTFFTKLNLTAIEHKKIYMKPFQYNIDYFEETTNRLTSSNILVLSGIDFRSKGETHNE